MPFKTGLEAFPSFHSQDGETAILECLGQAEKHDPQYALGLGADG